MMKFRSFLGIFVCFCIFSGCSKIKEDKSSGDKFSSNCSTQYVASTSWVASIAWLAGLDNVEIITPVSLKHPPEYEITPDDVLKISEADLFMYAGYERMMKNLSEAVGIREENQVKVTTTNSLENISAMVKMLSEKSGTEKISQERLENFTEEIEVLKKQVQEWNKNWKGKRSVTKDELRVFVNVNQEVLAREIGLNVTGTFGPGPLTAAQISEVSEKHYDIIIDNFHNTVAGPAIEVAGENCRLVVWRNFPEKIGENVLFEMIRENVEKLIKLYV